MALRCLAIGALCCVATAVVAGGFCYQEGKADERAKWETSNVAVLRKENALQKTELKKAQNRISDLEQINLKTAEKIEGSTVRIIERIKEVPIETKIDPDTCRRAYGVVGMHNAWAQPKD